MILSKKHRYIFLHCRKTAGTSVVVSLARGLGPDDLQLSGIPESIEHGILPPRRVWREAWAHAPIKLACTRLSGAQNLAKFLPVAIKSAYRTRLGDKPQHAPAVAVAKAFPNEWDKFTKFCVVRNPWERMVSDFFWRTRNTAAPPTFEAFIKAIRDGERLDGIVPEAPDNWPLYTIDDRIAVDHVVRFENLKNDLEILTSALGLSWDGWLPRAKNRAELRTAVHRPNASYTPELIGIVAELFEKEIVAFGYEAPSA